MATDHNFRIKNGLEVGGSLIVNSSGQLVAVTASSHIHYLDNVEAKFGNSGDLKIYHNGSNSYIDDVGTGALNIRSSGLYLEKFDGSEVMASFIPGGAATLNHSGSTKLQTQSWGVLVNGTLNTDKLHMGAGASDLIDVHHDGTFTSTYRNNTGGVLDRRYADHGNDGNTVEFQTRVGMDGNWSSLGNYSNHNFDIRTNNAVRATFTAAGNVGIGTTSPANKLHVNGTVKAEGAFYSNVTSGGGAAFVITHSGSEQWSMDARNGSSSTDYVDFGIAGGTRCMTWQDDGKVGIGTASPDRQLEVEGQGVIRLNATGSDTDPGIDFNTSSTNDMQFRYRGGTDVLAVYSYGTTSDVVSIKKADGYVGIGATAPATLLDLYKDEETWLRISGGTGDINGIRLGTSSGSRQNVLYRSRSSDLVTLRAGIDDSDIQIIAGGSANEIMRFDGSNSRVGIGTTTPATKLEVAGNITLPSDGQIKFRGTNHYPRIFAQSNDLLINLDNGTSNYTALAIDNATGTSTFWGGTSNRLVQIQDDGLYISRTSDGAYTSKIVSDTDTNNLAVYARSYINFYHNSSKIFSFRETGALGINEASPNYTIHATKDMASSPSNIIYLEMTGTNANGGGGAIRFDTSASNSDETMYYASVEGIRSASSNGSNELHFKTAKVNVNSNAPTTKMLIDEDGNVGIGTTSPSFQLHVLSTIGTRTLSLGHGVSSGTLTTDAAKALNFQQAGTTKMTLTSAGNLDLYGNMIIRDTAGTRGIFRNDDAYDLRLGGGVDMSDGAFISLGGENRGGSTSTSRGKVEIRAGGNAFANQAAILGDIVLGASWNGGTADILTLDSSSGNITTTGNILLTSNSTYVATRSILARDTNGLSLSTTNATTAISIDNSANVTMPYNLTVTGNLTVNGSSTTLNVATLDVEDKNITLNKGSGDTSGSANGAGITIQDAVDASTDATILWDATNDEFDFSHKINVNGHILGSGVISLTGTSGSTLYGLQLTRSGSGTTTPDLWGNNGTLVLGTSSTDEAIAMSGQDAITYGKLTMNQKGFAVSDAYYAWRRTYSVSTSSTKEILDRDGNSLDTAGVYTFSAHIPGTSVNGGTRAVFWNVDGTWRYNVTSQSGNSSNHPEFIIDATSNKPTIRFDHTSTYTVHVYHEWMRLNEESGGSDNSQAVVGADGYMSSVNGVLRYEPDGISDTGVDQWDEGYTIWHSNNAQQFTTTLKNKLDGIESNATADQTAADIRGLGFFDTSNDGSGSGLDADLLDGQHGSHYLNYNNLTNTPSSLPANGGNADTVDSLHASSFIRSDATDTATGQLTFSNNNNTYSGHHYFSAYDSNGNHYPHYRSGSGNNGAQINLRVQQSGGTGNDVLYIASGTNDITWRGNKLWNAGNDGSGSGLDADLVDGIHASSFLRSDAGDTSSATYIFSRTSTTPVFDISGHAGAANYNYFMRAGNDGGNKAVHFVNGSTRTADHGANAYVIRNDGGILVLGKTNYATKIYGSGDLTYNDNEVWHAGNDGSGSGLDADTLDGEHKTKFMQVSSGTKTTGDFNNFTDSGNFVISNHANISNSPPNSYAFGLLRVTQVSGTSIITQEYLAHSSGEGTFIRFYWSPHGWTSWRECVTFSSDGSGSGLDADLFDGHDSGSFLRSNVTDNYTSGTLSFNSGTVLKMLSGSDFDTSSGDVYANMRVIRNHGTANLDGMYIGYGNDNSGHTRLFGGGATSGGIYITGSGVNDIKYGNTSTFWHAGNDGSGSGLDADLLDGQHGSYYAPATGGSYVAKAGDTMSGALNMGNQQIYNINNLRFNDPGVNEGIKWDGGNEWQIYESPDNQSNASGNLQFTSGSGNGTIRMTLDTSGNLNVTGTLTATAKSFDIEHPTKEGMRLHHGVLEGPEHAVYIRGRTKGSLIQLPEYWTGLVHEDTITVQLTPIGKSSELYVKDISDNKVLVSNDTEYFYFIQAERKDVERFEVEYDDIVQ